MQQDDQQQDDQQQDDYQQDDHQQDERLGDEMWEPCSDFESTHSVSNCGRVRSIGRTTQTKRGPRRVRGTVLKPDYTHDNDYARVKLCVDGDETNKTVHSLVASTFHGPPPGPVGSKRDEYTVDHIDGDKQNNRADNLEWVTSQENLRRAMERGTIPRGSAHPRSKLTEADVCLMRELYASGEHTQKALADRFGIGRAQVSQIVRRLAWKHVV